MDTLFVFMGWIMSLCVHEFGHAVVAYWGGDTTVKHKGYLTLNPLKYTDFLMSIILPVVFLFFGGLPLPGAAVYIDEKRLRSRWWKSAVAVAGPLGSAIVAIVLAYLWKLIFNELLGGQLQIDEFVFPLLMSMAFLVVLNLYVMLLNLLPIPPLDGYRIFEPWLPEPIQRQLSNFSLLSLILLFILLFNFPPLSYGLFQAAFSFGTILGVDPISANTGRFLFEARANSGILALLLLCLSLPVLWRVFKYPQSFLANTLEILGFFLQTFGQFKPALACYNKALAIAPSLKSASLWMNRGSILFNLKEYEESLQAGDRAIELEGSNGELGLFSPIEIYQLWTNRGQALGMLQRYDEAIASYDRALELQKNFDKALLLRGVTLIKAGKSNEAVQTYDRLLSLQPKNVKILWFRASALIQLKRYEEALSNYDRALQLEPRNSDIWCDRGLLMRRLERNEEALSSYQRALKFNPSHKLAKCNQGWIFLEQERFDSALQLARELEATFPNEPLPLNLKGAALSRMGRAEEALATYDRAIQLQPDYANSWYNKACHYAEQGEVAEAISNLQRALELEPHLLDELATDKSFDSLRSLEPFQQILNEGK